MGVHGDRVTYTSDYFDDLYKLAVDMIKRGKAYADDTLQEKVCYQAFETWFRSIR